MMHVYIDIQTINCKLCTTKYDKLWCSLMKHACGSFQAPIALAAMSFLAAPALLLPRAAERLSLIPSLLSGIRMPVKLTCLKIFVIYNL